MRAGQVSCCFCVFLLTPATKLTPPPHPPTLCRTNRARCVHMQCRYSHGKDAPLLGSVRLTFTACSGWKMCTTPMRRNLPETCFKTLPGISCAAFPGKRVAVSVPFRALKPAAANELTCAQRVCSGRSLGSFNKKVLPQLCSSLG